MGMEQTTVGDIEVALQDCLDSDTIRDYLEEIP